MKLQNKLWIIQLTGFLRIHNSSEKSDTETWILPCISLVKYRIGLLMLKIANHAVLN